MITYEELLDEAVGFGMNVKEKPLQSSDGRTCADRIAVRKDMTTCRKACVLAEEMGHCFTTSGDILAQDNLDNVRQEYRARVWAFKKMLSVEQICEAAVKGFTQPHEIAEYLNVDEEFLRDYLAWQGILDISV